MTATFCCSLSDLLMGFSPAVGSLARRVRACFCRAFVDQVWRGQRAFDGYWAFFCRAFDG
jgi:hypothetical protein